jgi:hypothetical protein
MNKKLGKRAIRSFNWITAKSELQAKVEDENKIINT